MFQLSKQMIGLSAAVLLASGTVGAVAQTPSDSGSAAGASNVQILYSGQPLTAASLKIASWGGGTTQDEEGEAFTTSGHTIQIDTAGPYQGGQIIFPTPIDLGDLKANKYRFLQVIYSVAESSKYPPPAPATTAPPYGGAPYMGPAGPMMPGGPLGNAYSRHYSTDGKFVQMAQAYGPSPAQIAAMAAAAQAAARSGARRGRFGGGPGRPPFGAYGPMGPYGPGGMQPGLPQPDQTYAPPPLPINSVHVILQFADGERAEMMRPAIAGVGDDTTWLRASIPLSALNLHGSEDGHARLTDVYIGSDKPADISVGEILTLDDPRPITAVAGTAQTVPTGTDVNLVGEGQAGASMLKYAWDFNTHGAFVDDAEGNRVTHTFDKAGDYTVTLKVSDVDGIKKPAMSTVMIHVTDE